MVEAALHGGSASFFADRFSGEGIYMTRVCVDAMGGDEKPQVVLQGIEEALAADNDLSVLVVGDADVVEPFASSHERCEARYLLRLSAW